MEAIEVSPKKILLPASHILIQAANGGVDQAAAAAVAADLSASPILRHLSMQNSSIIFHRTQQFSIREVDPNVPTFYCRVRGLTK